MCMSLKRKTLFSLESGSQPLSCLSDHCLHLLSLLSALESSFGVILKVNAFFNTFMVIINAFMYISFISIAANNPGLGVFALFYISLGSKAILCLCDPFWKGQMLSDAVREAAVAMDKAKPGKGDLQKDLYRFNVMKERWV